MKSISILATLLLFATAVAVAMAQSQNQVFDQYTDVTGSARNMPRGQLWQSFTAGRTGLLYSVQVLMGTSYPCESILGQFLFRSGVPNSLEEPIDSETNVMISQTVVTTCPNSVQALEGGACANGDCLQWQEFNLTQPIALVEGQVYAFALSGFYSADLTRTARVGVSPPSQNNGGVSSLLISPIFQTQFVQYTFRTVMEDAQAGGAGLNPTGDSTTSSSSSSLASSGIAVIVVVAVLVVLVVGFVVLQRRVLHKRAKVFGSASSMISRSGDGHQSEHSVLVSTTPPRMRRGRYPIYVQSTESDGFVPKTWATPVSQELADAIALSSTERRDTSDTQSTASQSLLAETSTEELTSDTLPNVPGTRSRHPIYVLSNDTEDYETDENWASPINETTFSGDSDSMNAPSSTTEDSTALRALLGLFARSAAENVPTADTAATAKPRLVKVGDTLLEENVDTTTTTTTSTLSESTPESKRPRYPIYVRTDGDADSLEDNTWATPIDQLAKPRPARELRPTTPKSNDNNASLLSSTIPIGAPASPSRVEAGLSSAAVRRHHPIYVIPNDGEPRKPTEAWADVTGSAI